MLKYILIILIVFPASQADNITIDHNKSMITINEQSYKSSIIENNTEYNIKNNELILSNQYYMSRYKNTVYFIFDKNTLNLKKYLTIGCDNFTQICTGSVNKITKPLHISQTINEIFLDNIGECNIELISTYPNDDTEPKKIDTLNYRKVIYKINDKLHNFLYNKLYEPHRMYLTKNHTLYIPLCKSKSHQASILECKIIDGDFRLYSNIKCKSIENAKNSK